MAHSFNINDFRLVLNIVETASLTKGAEKSFISLSAASQRIKNLEDSLDLKLFQRTGQGVTPTEAALTYVEHARQILLQIDSLTSDLQAYNDGIKGRVKLLANTTAITEFLPIILGKFLHAHSNVQVDVRERLSDIIVRSIREGSADIGIISGSVVTDDLETKLLTSSKLVAIAHKDHPLLLKPKVSFKDVLKYDFVSLLEGSARHSYFHTIASNLHMLPKIRVQVASYDAIYRMVENDVGISVIPHSVLKRLKKNDSVRHRELTDSWAIRQYKICVRNFDGLSVFSKQLVAGLLAHFNSGCDR